MSIMQLLNRGARLSAGGIAVIEGERQIGYVELMDAIALAASHLREAGSARGARVGLISPNAIEALIVSYAVLATGATYVPIAATGTPTETAEALARFDISVLAFHPKYSGHVEDLKPQVLSTRYIALTELLAPLEGAASAKANRPIAVDLLDTAWMITTGGTTGTPKGVEISWRAINAYVQKFLAELALKREVLLLATPLTHAAGMLALPVLASGGTIVIANGFDPEEFISLVERHRASVTFLPPTGIYKLLDHPGVGGRNFESLRYFLYGAAPMALPRLREALQVIGPVMTQCYGQTECHTYITTMRPEDHFVDGDVNGAIADDQRLSACGRPNLGNIVEIRKDDGETAQPGELGEICVSSDLNMTGYFRDDEQTAATLVGGFILTGDVGFLDDEGFLHITDRKKDMIITGGFNVYPAEIEKVLHNHAAVREGSVVGLPDSYWGERIAAVVVLRQGCHVSEEDLGNYLRSALGPVKTPKSLQIWNELPKSPVGKILKREIRERLGAIQDVGGESGQQE